MTYKSLFTHINHHMTYYLSQTWPWCAEMPLHLIGTYHWCQVWVLPPKQLFCPFWWNKKRNYNWPFISRNMRLMGDVCSKVRFKKQIFCACQWVNCFNWVHLSRISNPHITCKVWTPMRWYIFVQDPATYIWIYIDDTGQSGVVWKGTVSGP